ncbi:hypothetical protein [Mesobacillus foraminis]|uniref:Uncharacterized protein n=1 Tax=Mesobacillus foraminis TaxID=279826 RepID=A0A4R2BG30_9BACI|nr:hypothetical protein [Mesobacillus foraminis]TCN25463.1 hypothetical protein EV146_105120 [Mesobacillus foraminis]
MIVKTKYDIETFKLNYCLFAEWDGMKYYITVPDTKNDGTITFIQYESGEFNIYRKNTSYWYIREQPLSNLDIWHCRKVLNEYLKDKKEFVPV